MNMPAISRAGSLTYNRSQLARLFLWLLTGSFGYCLLANVTTLISLSMKELGCSNSLMGVMLGSMPAAVNVIFNPWISTRSDRTRTAWGRRKPYLFIGMCLSAACILLLAWSPRLALRISGSAEEAYHWQLGFLIVFSVGFQVCFLLIATTIYYLFVDVVPQAVLGRFMAFFNMCGSAVGILFSFFLLKLSQSHMVWLYTGITAFFVVTMTILLLGVKEGEYAPVAPAVRERSPLEKARLYMRECFSIPFYFWIFFAMGVNGVSNICRSLFGLYFARDTLGLDLEVIGNINGFTSLLGFALAYPLGYLNDRFHPLRVFFWGGAAIVLVNLLSFFWISGLVTYAVSSVLLTVAYVVQLSAGLPLTAALFPHSKYGQFGSAQAIFCALMMILFNAAAGKLTDLFGNYRFLYAWDFVFTLLALAALGRVFVLWKQYGGDHHYVAPESDQV